MKYKILVQGNIFLTNLFPECRLLKELPKLSMVQKAIGRDNLTGVVSM